MNATNLLTSTYLPFLNLLLFLSLSFSTTGQNYWKGGTPGAETEWNNARNWSENHVPDWSDDVVIIPNVATSSGYFPIIKNEVPEIAHLNIIGGANLTITSSGSLTINGENTYNYGIINTGQVHNLGKLNILNTGLSALSNLDKSKSIKNEGVLAINEEITETNSYAIQ